MCQYDVTVGITRSEVIYPVVSCSHRACLFSSERSLPRTANSLKACGSFTSSRGGDLPWCQRKVFRTGSNAIFMNMSRTDMNRSSYFIIINVLKPAEKLSFSWAASRSKRNACQRQQNLDQNSSFTSQNSQAHLDFVVDAGETFLQILSITLLLVLDCLAMLLQLFLTAVLKNTSHWNQSATAATAFKKPKFWAPQGQSAGQKDQTSLRTATHFPSVLEDLW